MMLNKTSLKTFIAIFVAILLLASCDNKDPGKKGNGNKGAKLPSGEKVGEPVQGDWLMYHLSAEPDTLNLITATDAYASMINAFIYESLLERDPDTLELKTLLAEKYEVSEDKLNFTFWLKKGIKWHDGVELTTKDIKFSYDRIMDPKVDAPHLRNYYQDIESVEVIDNYTVRFKYSKKYFRALEFCGGIPIVPKHIFEKGDFNRHPAGRAPIGTGPLKFVKWDTGQRIILKRNENYWGEKFNLDGVYLKIITDDKVALLVLKKGELDMMGLRPIQWTELTKSEKFNSKFRKEKYYRPGYGYIGWNARKVYFKDKRVRTAMTMLIDREKILSTLLKGLGTVISGNFYFQSPENNNEIKPLPYDPARALKLLDEAGWIDHDKDGFRDKDGVKFEFEFMYTQGSRFAEQLGAILKEDLQKEGIIVNLRLLEWAAFIELVDAREFDAVTLGWSLGVESDPYQIWHSSQVSKGSNFVGFINKEADEIIEKARQEFDKPTRIKLYHRFHEIIAEEQPYTFLFSRPSLVALDRRFANAPVHKLGFEYDEWYVPKQFQKHTKLRIQ